MKYFTSLVGLVLLSVMAVAANADDTKATAKNLGQLNRNHLIWDQVHGNDTNDFLRFNVIQRQSVQFDLDQLRDNANMALYEQNGRLVKMSTQWGAAPERFAAQLNPGTYFLRITAVMAHPQRRWSNTRYRLQIKPQLAIPRDIGGSGISNGYNAVQVYPQGGRPWTLREWLGHPGDSADYFLFNVATPNQYQRFGARLTLGANARLDLYERVNNHNQPWRHIATGYGVGPFASEIRTNVSPGRYALRITYFGNAPVNYQLQMYTLMYASQNPPF